MDLRQLRYFVRIVDLGGLSRAARALHIAQPALSQQMARLEADLGAKLLLRSVRGVEPTPAGTILYGYAQAVLRQVDNATEHVRQASTRPVGQVWFGIPTSTAAVLAVPLIAAVQAAFPDVRLQVTEDLSNNLLSQLVTGRLDAAILFDPAPGAGLDVTPLVSEELMHVSRGGSTRRAREFGRTTLAQIASEAFILPRGQHTLRQFIEAAFAAARRPLRVAFELDSLHTLKLAVEAGLGSSILTWSVVHRDVVEGRLSARRINDLHTRRIVALCRAQLFPETPAAGAVCALLPGVVAGLVRRREWQGVELART